MRDITRPTDGPADETGDQAKQELDIEIHDLKDLEPGAEAADVKGGATGSAGCCCSAGCCVL